MNRFSFRILFFLVSFTLSLASYCLDSKVVKANEPPPNSELVSLNQSSDKLLLDVTNQLLINSVNRMGNFPAILIMKMTIF